MFYVQVVVHKHNIRMPCDRISDNNSLIAKLIRH